MFCTPLIVCPAHAAVLSQVVAHMGTDLSVESVVKRVEELVQGLH